MNKLIYFDAAATSYPKPKSVIRAVTNSLTDACGNPGRSAHPPALESAKRVYSCREAVSELFGFDKAENVVFTQNATLALNTAIKGLAKKHSSILFSNLEHNSVIRPVHDFCANKDNHANYHVFNALGSDSDVVKSFENAICKDTSLAVVTCASNICGKILPISRISKICKSKGITLILDASQSAGCVPMDFCALGADVICSAGHKSLYGPMGSGFCIFRDGLEIRPIIQGGNGVNSLQREMTGQLPELLEAGTVSVPCICGLESGIEYVKSIGIETIYQYGKELADYTSSRLKNIKGITVYGDCQNRTCTLLFNKEGIPSERACRILAENGICTRGGFHCAGLAHEALRTSETGAVRVSMSYYSTKKQVDQMLCVLNKME